MATYTGNGGNGGERDDDIPPYFWLPKTPALHKIRALARYDTMKKKKESFIQYLIETHFFSLYIVSFFVLGMAFRKYYFGALSLLWFTIVMYFICYKCHKRVAKARTLV